MSKQKKNEDLGIKLGSDDMVFWRNMIDSKKIDLKISEENTRFYKFIIENAEREYKKSEEEFNKSMKKE